MRVATWNVLHRIHAVNWGDGPLERFPREADRIDRITARVVEELDGGCDVMCLQEVSGDQLTSLRAALPDGVQVLILRYPRIPKLRDPGVPGPLSDPSEHLVTMVAGTAWASTVEGAVFPEDGGKGLLLAAWPGGAVVNTHVTYGEKRVAQLASLAAAARAQSGVVVLAGDFNADSATVGALLGGDFIIAAPVGSLLPTRPRTGDASKSQNIDHILVREGQSEVCAVVDVEALSDHNLVTARIVPR